MQKSYKFIIGFVVLLVLAVVSVYFLSSQDHQPSTSGASQQVSSKVSTTLEPAAQQTTASWPDNSGETSTNLVRLKVLESSQQFGRPIKLPPTQLATAATSKFSSTDSQTTLTSTSSKPNVETTLEVTNGQRQTQPAPSVTSSDDSQSSTTGIALETNSFSPQIINTKSTAMIPQDNEITTNTQQNTVLSSSTTSTTKQEELESSESWKAFTLNYGRTYPNREEELKRRENFLKNERFVLEHNAKPDRKFSLALNHFADLTRDEINQIFIGPQVDWVTTLNQLQVPFPEPIHILSENGMETQEGAGSSGSISVDWRNVTAGEPIDQGLCRESSVYAAVASIEAAMNSAAMSSGSTTVPTKLSERQVLDCMALVTTTETSPPLCQGFTSMLQVFDLLQHSTPGSMISPTEYQEALDHSNGQTARVCLTPFDWRAGHAKLASFNLVHRDNIPDALLNNGPLAVALDASQSTFHFYKEGLYHDDNCSTNTYNHHALLVGYNMIGKSSEQLSGGAQSYYLLRNTFGPKWGESGYMRLLKDENNKCLPHNLAISPNLKLVRDP